MRKFYSFLFAAFIISHAALSQSPGYITSPAGGNGATPLNPDGNAFTSATTSGFTTNDITQSEIPYKIIKPFITEPTGDLLRGPATRYSDIVRNVDSSGFYVYSDGTNLMFRIRIGNFVSGSKGYSALIDADSKFGGSGPNADTNFKARTTGSNGNPGFEYEVVLESNFDVAIYDIEGWDGVGPKTAIHTYGITTNSQISVALSTVSGDPDYFYDFYVPIAGFNGSIPITATTPLRMVATTVMAPQGAVGGPKSDIYGLTDADYMKGWETEIAGMPSFTPNDVKSTGTGVGAYCTAAPVMSTTVLAGSNINVSGTWASADASKPGTAKIYIYRNSVLVDSVAGVTSTWNKILTATTLAAGDVLYAKAKATGESMCLQSNNVIVSACSTYPSSPTVTCFSNRGFSGVYTTGDSVQIYTVTASTANNGLAIFSGNGTGQYPVKHTAPPVWYYDDANSQSGDPCGGGAQDVSDGVYAVTQSVTGNTCPSEPTFICVGLTQTATPTFSDTLYNGGSIVQGKTVANAVVRLYKNGVSRGAVTADASGNFSFTGLGLVTGDVMHLYAQSSGLCVSNVASKTVKCFTSVPIITTGSLGTLMAGATTIAGTSSEYGGTVYLYEGAARVASATVSGTGTWSFTRTVVASTSYTVKQLSTTCTDTSAASTAALGAAATSTCPTLGAASYSSASPTISGSIPTFTGTIRVYQDSVQIGSTSITAATSWSIPVNTLYSNKIYPGAVIYATGQTTGAFESIGCPSTATTTCTTPTTPSYSSTTQNISTGQTVNYTITNADVNRLYTIVDSSNTTITYSVTQKAAGTSLVLTSRVFNSPGSYGIKLQGLSTESSTCNCTSTSASIMVTGTPLPLNLLSFSGVYDATKARLTWNTSNELMVDYFILERSADGQNYVALGKVPASGATQSPNEYHYTDDRPLDRAYYRLSIIDNDGSRQYSNAIVLSRSGLTVATASITPNPFRDEITVAAPLEAAASISCYITDIAGKTVMQGSYAGKKGLNIFKLSALESLQPGLYMIQLFSNNKVMGQQRLEKQ